jgi:integrase
MALSFIDVRNARPNADGSPLILRDGDGLDLWITPTRKTWRCKVQRNGKRTTLNLGTYPEMSIVQARAARMKARTDTDPAGERRAAIAASEAAATETFHAVAERWMTVEGRAADWKPSTRNVIALRLNKHVMPGWGKKPIGAISTRDVETLFNALADRSPATAVIVKQYVMRIFDYAAAHDLVPFNPTSKIARYLPKRHVGTETHRAFVRTIEDARAVLAAVERRAPFMQPSIVLAHRFIALTGVRKIEALGAKWAEFDLANAAWTIPASRMKGRRGRAVDHVVALAPQAVEVLEAARRLRRNEFVFPSRVGGGRQMNRSSLNAIMQTALRNAGLGDVMVAHGWRSTFSTIMNERAPDAFRIIDVMLAHKAFRDSVDATERKASVEGRYNHARHISARHRIACEWADLLLEGAPPALALAGLDEKVVPLRRAVA